MTKRPASITQQAIRAISAGAVASLLRPLGFKRRAPHLWRETGGIYHSVNFQASQWGTNEDGQFTVNLGVSSPILYASFTGRTFPTNPGSALWPINVRIGGLMPSRCDLWWQVTDHTDLDALGTEVAQTLHDYALPFFERLRTAEQFNSLLLSDQPIPGVTAAQRPLIGAMVAVQLGRRESAHRMLSVALNEHRGKPFESTVRSVARRLQVELHGA